MKRCRPKHDWNKSGQCRRCSRWRDRTAEHYIEAFWAKVKKGRSCWLWMARVDGDGYAQYSTRGTSFKAARWMWLLQNGSLPRDKEVCHTCDNRRCVRPGHLFLGSHRENMEDMYRKKGATTARLRADEVREIRKLLKDRVFHKDLAWMYGVSVQTITRIANGTSWRIMPKASQKK